MIILICSFKLNSVFSCIQLQILYLHPSCFSSSGQKCMRLDAGVDTGSSSVINVMLKRGEVSWYTWPVISLSGFSIISNILEISCANSGVLSPKIFTAPHSFSHPRGQVVLPDISHCCHPKTSQ